MIFYQISQPEDLEPGYFGIREPKTSLPVADGEDGLMIMPGVAFDNQRHRVGYGGGFYDRYLSRHTSHFTAALAFEFQMMEEVPTEPTDLLPDVVITENNLPVSTARQELTEGECIWNTWIISGNGRRPQNRICSISKVKKNQILRKSADDLKLHAAKILAANEKIWKKAGQTACPRDFWTVFY